MASFRTLLTLGRVSNLPTVWSNCLAGWWLGGGGNLQTLTAVLVGGTFLYVGGMFMNDAFDLEFDRLYRKERPIPSGAITLEAVWRWGLGWLAGGALILILLMKGAGILTLLLLVCIILYDAVHKWIAFAPVLMGACRFLLYLVAASAGAEGVTGWAIWGGLALAIYIVGLSYIARVENAPGALRYWPVIFLAAPIVLALIMSTGVYRQKALLLSILLAVWIIRCLRTTFWATARDIGRTVSGLLAGIVLVDLLAIVDFPAEVVWVFPVLFILALLLQRFVPAT